MDKASSPKLSNDLPSNTSLCSGALNSPPAVTKSIASQHEASLVTHLKPGQVLYDIAESTLHKRATITGETVSQRHIFLEVNRIMVNSGFQDAHLKNVLHPTDADLPEQWNSVTNHTRLVLYTAKEASSLKHSFKKGKNDAEKLKGHHGKNSNSDDLSCLEVSHFGFPHNLKPDGQKPPNIDGPQGPRPDGPKPLNNDGPPGTKPDGPKPPSNDGPSGRNPDGPKPPNDSPPGSRLAPPKSANSDGPPVPKSDKTKSPTDDALQGSKADGPKPLTSDCPQVPKSNEPNSLKPDEPKKSLSDLLKAANQLQAQQDVLQQLFAADVSGQGFLGKTFDIAKNYLGSSAEGHSWLDPRSLWSNVLNSDLGSNEIKKQVDAERDQLDVLHQAAVSSDLNAFKSSYKNLTGNDYQGVANTTVHLKNAELASKFNESQQAGVENEADILAALAAAALKVKGGGSLAKTLPLATIVSGSVGAVTKVILKQVDGQYADLKSDLVTGSIAGASIPIGDLAGNYVSKKVVDTFGTRLGLSLTGELLASRIETQGTKMGIRLLSSAAKSGTTGAVFGGLDSPVQEIMQDDKLHKPVDGVSLLKATAKGAFGGFVGGTLLGLTFDGLADKYKTATADGVVPTPPTNVNGVQIGNSGTTDLIGAAKILGKDPDQFLHDSTQNPYQLVKEAVALYEKHGINIEKFDPDSGTPLLPEKFTQALGVSQSVDLATKDIPLSLATKAETTALVNKYIDSQPHTLTDSFNKALDTEDYTKFETWLKSNRGIQAAEQMRATLQTRFETEVRVDSSVEHIKYPGTSIAQTVFKTTQKVQSDYTKKGADFFADISDPQKQARLGELVDDIFSKFNSAPVNVHQLADIIKGAGNNVDDQAAKAGVGQQSVGIVMTTPGASAETESAAGKFNTTVGEAQTSSSQGAEFTHNPPQGAPNISATGPGADAGSQAPSTNTIASGSFEATADAKNQPVTTHTGDASSATGKLKQGSSGAPHKESKAADAASAASASGVADNYAGKAKPTGEGSSSIGQQGVVSNSNLHIKGTDAAGAQGADKSYLKTPGANTPNADAGSSKVKAFDKTGQKGVEQPPGQNPGTQKPSAAKPSAQGSEKPGDKPPDRPTIWNDADDDLPLRILERSATNGSDTNIQKSMQALKSEIEQAVGLANPDLVTLRPSSSGNFLGYLYRKANSVHLDINNLDKLESRIAKGDVPKSVVIFDDISKLTLTAKEKAVLSQIANVYVVDLSAFEKGVNVLDYARGPKTVSAKLDGLVSEGRTWMAQHPGATTQEAALAILDGAVNESATNLGANVKLLRAPVDATAAPMHAAIGVGQDPVQALWDKIYIPRATRQEIAGFLSQYSGSDRELASQMIADGAVHNSFSALFSKAAVAVAQIEQQITDAHSSLKDLLIVPDKDPGGSTHLVSYLFGNMPGITPENFVSSQQIDTLIRSHKAAGKTLLYLDDTIYSGNQMASSLQNNIHSFMPFRNVLVGSFGAFEDGVNRLKGTHLMQIGKAKFITVDRYSNFYSPNNQFYSKFLPNQQAQIRNIGGANGYGGIQGYQIWPYMWPDNNLEFFGPEFSGKVLKLPGP